MTVTVTDQAIGGVVNLFNNLNQDDLVRKLSDQNSNFVDALGKIESVREFISSPEHILGSTVTKHGEIAEQVEVAIINAREAVMGLPARATFDGLSRTAPADYMIDNSFVQSKFINGTNNTLKHVLEHLEKYPEWKEPNRYYHIPKNQYEEIQKILNGESLEKYSLASINALRNNIVDIEKRTDRLFNDVIRTANTNYEDVLLGRVNNTLDNYDQELRNTNDKQKMAIHEEHAPSLQAAAQAAAVGAIVGATFSSAIKIYNKKKSGKDIKDFTANDWKDIGLDATKNGVRGGASGFAIYALTNLMHTSAPLASGVVSASFGVVSLANDLYAGKISFEEFVDQGLVVCFDSSAAVLGASVGQTLIPIPVIGAIVGSISMKFLIQISKKYLKEVDIIKLQKYHKEYESSVQKMHDGVEKYLKKVNEISKNFKDLLDIAFNVNLNIKLRVEASVELAKFVGVPDGEILKNSLDRDGYFLK